MEQRALSDPDTYPSDKVLASHLKRSHASYLELFEFNHTAHPDFVERWRYYNDGKSWLLNVSRKKKTVFWVGVNEGSFRTSFSFSAKVEQDVLKSRLPAEIKRQYRDTAGNHFRGISLVIKAKKDVETYKELLSIKLATL